jgi:multicomponent Na+:H+ antiporter subunit D
MLVPVWILVAANLYFGINTDISVGAAMQAATMLMGAGG